MQSVMKMVRQFVSLSITTINYYYQLLLSITTMKLQLIHHAKCHENGQAIRIMLVVVVVVVVVVK